MHRKTIIKIIVVLAPIAALIQCTQFSTYKLRKDYTINLSLRNDDGALIFQGKLDTTCIREDGLAFGGDRTSSYYIYPTFHKIKLDANKDAYIKSINTCMPNAGDPKGVELYLVNHKEPEGIVIGYITDKMQTKRQSQFSTEISIKIKKETKSKYQLITSTQNDAEKFISQYECYQAEQYHVPMHLRFKLEQQNEFSENRPSPISYDVFKNDEWKEIRDFSRNSGVIFPVSFSIDGKNQITRIATESPGEVYCKIYNNESSNVNTIDTSYVTVNGKRSNGSPLTNKPLQLQNNYIAYGNAHIFKLRYRQVQ